VHDREHDVHIDGQVDLLLVHAVGRAGVAWRVVSKMGVCSESWSGGSWALVDVEALFGMDHLLDHERSGTREW
jgi:hypothetical protein